MAKDGRRLGEGSRSGEVAHIPAGGFGELGAECPLCRPTDQHPRDFRASVEHRRKCGRGNLFAGVGGAEGRHEKVRGEAVGHPGTLEQRRPLLRLLGPEGRPKTLDVPPNNVRNGAGSPAPNQRPFGEVLFVQGEGDAPECPFDAAGPEVVVQVDDVVEFNVPQGRHDLGCGAIDRVDLVNHLAETVEDGAHAGFGQEMDLKWRHQGIPQGSHSGRSQQNVADGTESDDEHFRRAHGLASYRLSRVNFAPA